MEGELICCVADPLLCWGGCFSPQCLVVAVNLFFPGLRGHLQIPWCLGTRLSPHIQVFAAGTQVLGDDILVLLANLEAKWGRAAWGRCQFRAGPMAVGGTIWWGGDLAASPTPTLPLSPLCLPEPPWPQALGLDADRRHLQ